VDGGTQERTEKREQHNVGQIAKKKGTKNGKDVAGKEREREKIREKEKTSPGTRRVGTLTAIIIYSWVRRARVCRPMEKWSNKK